MARYCAIIGVASASIAGAGGERSDIVRTIVSDCARRGNCQHRRHKQTRILEAEMKKIAALSLSALLLASGALGGGARPADKPPGLPAVDSAVSPCQDFYVYACHQWMAANPSPPDQSRWGPF